MFSYFLHVFRKRQKGDFEVGPSARERLFGVSSEVRMRISVKTLFSSCGCGSRRHFVNSLIMNTTAIPETLMLKSIITSPQSLILK